MTGWIVLAVYVVGLAISWRRFTRAMLNSLDHEWRYLDDGDRFFSAFIGLAIALVWPAGCAFLVLKRLLLGGLRSDREIATELRDRLNEQALELDRLKKIADSYGLPFPPAPPTRVGE